MESMVTAMHQGYRTGESWWPPITTLRDPASELVIPGPEIQIPMTPVFPDAIHLPESQESDVTGDTTQEKKEDDV
ncbi:hypothetical protein OP853_004902, partial [Salmonella enterica]|nr:hypothetical protein [Salmonella enterica]